MMSIKKELPIYDVVLLDGEGIEFISIVEDPAHQVGFIALSDESETVHLKLSDEKKQYFTGPVLIPGKEIIRRKPNPHYIRFSADQIEKMRNRFFKTSGSLRSTNVEHSDKKVDAVVIESWITKQNDTRFAEFADLPQGTWMVTMHVPDQVQYQELLSTGKSGFSIEGILSQTRAKLSSEEDLLAVLVELVEKLSRKDEE